MFGNFKRLPFFYWIYLSVVYHEDVCGGSSIENINILQNNEKDRNEFLTNFLSLSASSLLKGNLLYLLFIVNKSSNLDPQLQKWSRKPVVKQHFLFPVVVHNFFVFWDEMRDFFPENFAERVVILHNCPKGRWWNHRSICWWKGGKIY